MPALDYEKIAYIYDTYVQTNFDLDYFIQETKNVSGKVLELMSGTGRVSIPLIEAGADLTCVDSSPAMLDIFRKKLKERGLFARVVEADVCELDLEDKYDLIFIPFHSFVEIVSLKGQKKALDGTYDHLSDSGKFICTLHNPAVRLKTCDRTKREIGIYPMNDEGGTLQLFSREEYLEEERIVEGNQYYEFYDKTGKLLSSLNMDIRFYVHNKKSFEFLAESSGFKIKSLFGGYSREEFVETESPVMIWILGK